MVKPIRGLVIGDIHTGSTVAVWPGVFRVEGGGTYKANKFQRWLYKCWQDMVAEVRRIRPRFVVINGDAIQGSNTKDGQLVTTRLSVQRAAGGALLEPIFEAADEGYVLQGTEWHEGPMADNTEGLAKDLGAVENPDTGQHVWPERYLRLGRGRDAPVIHFAHHIGFSSVAQYEATVPLRDLLILLTELVRWQPRIACNLRMIVRSHRHRMAYVRVPPDLHALVVPGWQLRTARGLAKAPSLFSHVGYAIIEYDGVDLLVRERTFPLPGVRVGEVTGAEGRQGELDG